MTPYHESDGVVLYHGDNVQTMRDAIPDASIDLVVTSPPYDNLRTYGGHTWDFEGVAQQLWRVIKPGGVVVWVVADATVDGSETGTSFRQALRFMEIGFKLHDTMIYRKLNYLPQNAPRRYDQCFEYCFVLSLSDPKHGELLRDRRNAKAGQTLLAGGRKNADGKLHDKRVITSTDFGLRSNIWDVPVSGEAFNHPAIFPESLARDHILSWSNEGDTVLDPFSGSGTTVKMARLMGRKGIGIEIHQEYCDIAAERLRQKLLF